jgi:Domain of unknown function (DUF4349)
MPVLDPLTDPRFTDLIDELRSAAVSTPDSLHDRVETLLARAASERVLVKEPWTIRLRRALNRRVRLRARQFRWLAAAALTASGVVIAYGVITSAGPSSSSGSGTTVTAASQTATPSGSTPEQTVTIASGAPAAADTRRGVVQQPQSPLAPSAAVPPLPVRGSATLTVPPTPGRYQLYAARIRISVPSVDRLSSVTARVITTTQQLGGYVLSVEYGQATSSRGASYLDVKVPVDRVQTAIARFSSLGTIASEHVSIQDEQGSVDALANRISDLELRIAQLNAALAAPSLSAVDAVTLRFRRAQAQHDLDQARSTRSATIAKASYAELLLTFAVAAPVKAKKAAGGSSLIGRSARGGLHLLGVVASVVIYASIVVVPFALVAALAWIATRSFRRRRDRQVLERA